MVENKFVAMKQQVKTTNYVLLSISALTSKKSTKFIILVFSLTKFLRNRAAIRLLYLVVSSLVAFYSVHKMVIYPRVERLR